ncbi:hypothetical protein BH09ACT11_BH09ACT11_18950 [soil metagenome]
MAGVFGPGSDVTGNSGSNYRHSQQVDCMKNM